ncbi:LytR family transcriptional regulator [Nocardia panacis]|uniref:LytR family transcriptional regulator n=1 Tax=Nocardia panacis TaxID=2340916 RepID=A0A3A4KB90_9NOCA|nr:LCP family protein [Nocardia panacis]RJO69878.1 LytR family transcriptional regulator [Nocardia panacis]
MNEQTKHRIASERARARHRRVRGVHRRRARQRIGRTAVKVCAGALSVAVLAATAVGWAAAGSFDSGFGRSSALADDAPRSLGDDLNILLVGLDTRKDQNGDNLPPEILSQLHAGDGEEGGYNANTLILVHIPADMKNIVAVSIPRDDYVRVTGIPGYGKAKIKEAYGLKKAAVQDRMINQGVTDQATLEHAGREAGRASIVQAVRDLTGVPIDRFAEVTLGGFYDLANALGGVEVCLNHAVQDLEYSGADFPAGRQRLDPAQALAFVRQRHGLENGDLDRTHRQQAFLTSVANELKSSGTLTDVRKLSALMDVAHRNIVLSDGWNATDFVRTLGSADSPTVEFRTLPVLRYDVVNGQDVNIVDPVAIRREVQSAFGMAVSPTTPATSTPNISDGDASSDGSTLTTMPSGTPGTSTTPIPDSGKPVETTITGSSVPCVN